MSLVTGLPSDFTEPLLEVDGVTLRYKTPDHRVTATYRVSFEVLPSDRFVLLGPSGCGKSTLLKSVGGYMAPTEGQIRLKGQVVTEPGPDRMMVFQEFDQPHPDGMAALLAGQEVSAHFTAAPIQELELRRPGIRTLLDTFDVLGAPSTFNVVWASSAFVEANPIVHAAFTAALEEAVAFIAGDPKGAAQAYARLARDGSDVGLIESILAAPQVNFTTTSQAILRYVDFMARTKAIRRGARDWRDLFFANVHAKPGS